MSCNIVESLMRQSIAKFILLIAVCNLVTDCLSLPFFFITSSGDLNNGTIEIDLIGVLLFPVLVSPLIETFVEQMIPIYAMSRITNKPWLTIGVSAIVFSIVHGFDNFPRLIPSALSGILLAFSFWRWSKDSYKKAYWITSVIHGLHNLVITVLFIIVHAVYE